jgi:hypothetical protein
MVMVGWMLSTGQSPGQSLLLLLLLQPTAGMAPASKANLQRRRMPENYHAASIMCAGLKPGQVKTWTERS